VLIHGWAMHGGVFAPLVDALAGRCTLHVVDLPGHGRSRDCGLPLPCFVRKPGWDFGVDAEVFRQFGRDLDGDYRATLERFLALEAMGSEYAREEMRRLRAALFARGEPDPRVLHEGLDLLDRADLRDRVAELAQPSAWIGGSRDRLIPWQAMQWSAGQCGGSFTRIAHAGHAPFIGFAADVAAAIEPLPGTPA
jgi:pimeloyl-[acyl-carrier protein] methyl ester esterase